MRMLKKAAAVLLSASLLTACTAGSASAWMEFESLASKEQVPVSDKIGDMLEGIFDGRTIEVEDPARDNVGFVDVNKNGTIDDAGDVKMHFPDFVKVGDTIYAYHIQWDDKNGEFSEEHSCIGLSTTKDGIHFDYQGIVLYPDPATGYDGFMASFPGMWYEDGVFYMTYECNQSGGNGDIALATSTDGRNFTKHGVILRYNPSYRWQSYNIGTPDLYKDGDTWYLTFHGFGSDKRDCQIGVAYGTDIYNLTMYKDPIVPTSSDAAACDSGTCGHRDVIKYGDYYYMAYECSTDGGQNGRPYYDFGGSDWGHTFARSKDFINWEKAPEQLHASYHEGMCFDGPAWFFLNDQMWIYYRNLTTTTNAVQLYTYGDITDEASGITIQGIESETLTVDMNKSGYIYDLIRTKLPGKNFSISKLTLNRGGEKAEPIRTIDVAIPVPSDVVASSAKVYSTNDTFELTELNAELKDDGCFHFSADTLGRYVVAGDKLDKTVATDSYTGCTAEVLNGQELKVTVIEDEATQNEIWEKLKVIAGEDKVAGGLEIHFEKDGETVQPGFETALTIVSPYYIKYETAKLYKYADGEITEVAAEYDSEKGVFSLKTDTLGTYLVAGDVIAFGDVDGDSVVGSSDALKILQYSVGKTTLDIDQKNKADVNLDGRIDSSDALLILQYAVGKADTFPA